MGRGRREADPRRSRIPLNALLLDAGVWIAAKDGEDRYSEAARLLAVDSDQAVAALDLTLYEVANVVGARKRRSDDAMRSMSVDLRTLRRLPDCH